MVFKRQESHVLSGPSHAPQGSKLGPLLFILMINDLPDVIQYSRILFNANDVNIFRLIRDCNDARKDT